MLGTHKKGGSGKEDSLVVKKDKNGMVFCPVSKEVHTLKSGMAGRGKG